jgi:hypothetical protein
MTREDLVTLLRLLPLAVLVAGAMWCLLALLFVSGGPAA